MRNVSDIPEGTRVCAPNDKAGEEQHGVIVDNLTVMYFIKFDNGDEAFLYKAEPVIPLED